MRYVVTATVTLARDEIWSSTRSLPTFLLDSNIQGIVSADHAARVALGLLRDCNPDAEVHVTAVAEDHSGTGSAQALPAAY